MKAETKFKEKILVRLREIPNSWVVKVQQVAIRGTPDILMCVNGHFVAIELKTDDGEADELQIYTLDRIRKAGGHTFVMTPRNSFLTLKAIKELK